MSKRKRYRPEYKHELIELVRRSTSSCRKVALEVGVNPGLLTRWVREAEAGGTKAFPGGGTQIRSPTYYQHPLMRQHPAQQKVQRLRHVPSAPESCSLLAHLTRPPEHLPASYPALSPRPPR